MRRKLFNVLTVLAVCVDALPEATAAETATVIRFKEERDRTAEEFGSFGIFRDPTERPQVQFVQDKGVARQLPERGDVRFLELKFLLRKAGAYNGWWLKPHQINADGSRQPADWSRFRRGQLLLSIRTEHPSLQGFKVEIKTPGKVYSAIVSITDDNIRTIRERGTVDIALPLANIIDEGEPLTEIKEFVIVFEQRRVGVPLGVLLLHSITLTDEPPETRQTNALLETLEQKAFAYFLDHRHPKSGFVRDRAANLDNAQPNNRMSSVAATGYFLSALPIAVERGWMNREAAISQARKILTAAATIPHHAGLFYHFVDWETGQPCGDSEVSVLDSGIFLLSAMTAAVAFPEVAPLADDLLKRVDWQAFIVEKDGKKLLALGWTEENGLIGAIDVRTAEAAMPLLVACGYDERLVECWYNTLATSREIAGYRVLHGHLPLFVSYYGLSWADLNGFVDCDGVDLHQNAINAALANRSYCRDLGSRNSETYSLKNGQWWGISAGDSSKGYVAPGPIYGDCDGTVWPTAALGTVRFIPELIEQDLSGWRKSEIWDRVDGRYGLAPFNLSTGWIGNQIIAIDLGSFLLNAANARNRTVSRLWKKHPVAQIAWQRIGFTKLP